MPRFRAIHTIELKPDIEGELFEDFMMREFLPAIRFDARLPRGGVAQRVSR